MNIEGILSFRWGPAEKARNKQRKKSDRHARYNEKLKSNSKSLRIYKSVHLETFANPTF
jgi:hypothetical protein